MSNNRSKIMEHALALLKERGYSNWSYDHIAKKMNIRKASIHYYFPTKEDLVDNVLEIYIDDFYKNLEEKTSKIKNTRDKLKILFGIYKKTCESKREICLCTILTSDFFNLSDRIKLRLEQFYSRQKEWIGKQIASSNVEDSVRQNKIDLIMNTLQGLMLTSKILEDNDQFDNCICLLLD